jgi:hypothetical protein
MSVARRKKPKRWGSIRSGTHSLRTSRSSSSVDTFGAQVRLDYQEEERLGNFYRPGQLYKVS